MTVVSQANSPYKVSATDSGDVVVSGGWSRKRDNCQFRRLSDDQQRRIGKRFALVRRQRDNFRY
jgi:hypothetical protein